MSFAEALIAVGAQLGRRIDPQLVDAIVGERRQQNAALFEQVDPAALAMLRSLRDAGCRLAIVSNCFAEDVDGWPQCAASDYVDAQVFSFEIGAAKPEPQIYVAALHRLQREACDALFIGDGGDDELQGAERAGLSAVHATWFSGARAGLPARFPRLSSWASVVERVGTANRTF